MTGFEPAMLPDAEKERLCRALLSEFGVTSIKASSGGELIHSCCLPFGLHKNGDRNPSASLNFKKLTYNCLGCGNSGGLLWFIAVCRGEETKAARKWLEDKTGTGPDEMPLAQLLSFFESVYEQDSSRPPLLPRLDPRILDRWLFLHPYMTEIRGCDPEVLMRFMVGYDSSARIQVGDGWISSERIIIPHFWKGNLVGWQSRRLADDGTPKYHNSPDFPKEWTLYNYDPARTAVVVESVLSVLRHEGVHHLECTFSAKVTNHQVKLLSMHPSVILCFDNDEPGWKATQVVGEALIPYTNVWVWQNQWSADPADMDPQTFGDLVSDPIPYPLWTIPAEVREWPQEVAVA